MCLVCQKWISSAMGEKQSCEKWTLLDITSSIPHPYFPPASQKLLQIRDDYLTIVYTGYSSPSKHPSFRLSSFGALQDTSALMQWQTSIRDCLHIDGNCLCNRPHMQLCKAFVPRTWDPARWLFPWNSSSATEEHCLYLLLLPLIEWDFSILFPLKPGIYPQHIGLLLTGGFLTARRWNRQSQGGRIVQGSSHRGGSQVL